MTHHINTPNKQQTEPGNCVYEIHFQHEQDTYDTIGGWSIRFVEGLDTPTGQQAAIDAALDDVYKLYSEEALQDMSPPKSTNCHRHDGWESLRQLRQIKPPKAGTKIRGPKRGQVAQDLFDFLEGVG